jgi:hypothetical protein
VSIHGVWQRTFSFFGEKPVVVERGSTQLSSDAGLLVVREFDERIRWTEQFAAALSDRRSDAEHSLLDMVRMRVYGILADYEDQNDHSTLRKDPVFKLIAGRSPDDSDLASQSTLSRFENSVDIASLNRLRDVFIDAFIASFETPPARLTLDIDPFDDPTHGRQQLTFFHGYYGQHQYQPRVITCAENDLVVMACLLHGTAHAALGAEDDVEYLVRHLRAAWPDVSIHLRGDSAFATPAMFEVSERLTIDFTFGLKMNPVLKRESEALLAECVGAWERDAQPQRRFHAFEYEAGSWPHARWTIIKVEAHAEGINRRGVITNRPGARVLPGAAYDDYADRGESENRNKELKCRLKADRLSDHRYLANLFRLYLHAAALNLLVRLRRTIASPPDDLPEGIGEPAPPADLPREALQGRNRRRWFNHRRECDPLGEGHADTWRTRLIKVAAEFVVSTRRILVRLSGCWPHFSHFESTLDKVQLHPATGSS